MSTVRTTTTTTRTTVVTSPGSSTVGNRSPSTTARNTAGRPGATGRSGGGRSTSSRRSGGGGSGCNCGGAGGGGLAAAAHWLALAAAIIIIVAWIFRYMIKGYNSAPVWFEFLLFLFLALMVILGGFGIGGLDEFLEEYLQLTISMLGKGVLLLLFCCRVYANVWEWSKSGTAILGTIASVLCCVAAVLAVLVLLVGLGVAK